MKTKNPLTTITMAVIAAIAMASTMISFTAIITTEDQQAYAQVTGGSNSATCNLSGSTTCGSSPITQSCSQSQGMCLLGQESGRDAAGSISGSECS